MSERQNAKGEGEKTLHFGVHIVTNTSNNVSWSVHLITRSSKPNFLSPPRTRGAQMRNPRPPHHHTLTQSRDGREEGGRGKRWILMSGCFSIHNTHFRCERSRASITSSYFYIAPRAAFLSSVAHWSVTTKKLASSPTASEFFRGGWPFIDMFCFKAWLCISDFFFCLGQVLVASLLHL